MNDADTLWHRWEQTGGKHEIFKNYLAGWIPILGRFNGRLLIIDGFAGPGEYVGGEPGSPLIVLDQVNQFKRDGRLRGTEVQCLFIESRPDRADHLRNLIKNQMCEEGVECTVVQGSFEEHMTEILDYIETQNQTLAPAFVMIDPFGVKGSGMDLIGRILKNKKSECMISFMYEAIRRFHTAPQYEESLNELFGTTAWKQAASIQESKARTNFFHDLFASQLRDSGARYVVPFELWEGNNHVLTLYLATGSLKGCDLMKKTIWKVEPSGIFAFRGHVDQQRLEIGSVKEKLGEELKTKFGQEFVHIEVVERFVMSDETNFHTGHLRRETLAPLERENRIIVDRPQGVRGFQNGKGIRLRFR